MPAMNISLQRRIGRLPKSPDYLDNIKPTIFENNHRGFGTRTPTPTYTGFFGIGKHAKGHDAEMAAGDTSKSVAWYGNDGTRSLPVAGVYGIGAAPGQETVMPARMDFKPSHWNTPGLFGIQDTLTQNWKPIVGGVALLAVARHYKYI